MVFDKGVEEVEELLKLFVGLSEEETKTKLEQLGLEKSAWFQKCLDQRK